MESTPSCDPPVASRLQTRAHLYSLQYSHSSSHTLSSCLRLLPRAADAARDDFKRFRFGMRWWEDVYFNDGEGIYPMEFRRAYPKV